MMRRRWIGWTGALAWAGAALFAAGAPPRPWVTVPSLPRSPPVAAQAEEDPAWSAAARVWGFLEDREPRLAEYETEVRLGYTDEALYLRFFCHYPEGTIPRGGSSARDAISYVNDTVGMVFVAPRPDGTTEEYQLYVSASGGVGDWKDGTWAWDGEWAGAARAFPRGWVAVARIPFATLGLAGPPETMRFQLTRWCVVPEVERSALVPWSVRRGTLFFSPDRPAVALARAAREQTDRFTLTAEAVTLPATGFVDSELTLLGPGGSVLAHDVQQPRFDSRTVVHSLPLGRLDDGAYSLRYRLKHADEERLPAYYGGGTAPAAPRERDGDDLFVAFDWPLQIDSRPGLEVSLRLRDRGQTLYCRLHARGRVEAGPAARYRFDLLDEEGSVPLKHLGTLPFEPGETEFLQPLPDLPERTRYRLRVRLEDGGTILLEDIIPFATPSAPAWLEEAGAQPAGVPEPWEPVLLDGRTVRVWGRSYTFDTGPAPSQVTSLGRELLSSPARLVMVPAPAEWILTGARLEGPEDSRTAAVLSWRGTGGEGYTAETAVRFDGSVRVDVTVPAGLTASRLALEIPYRRERALYVHRGPVRFGGVFTTYALPEERRTYGYLPNFFLLDNQGGLCWFDGMPFDWPLQNRDRILELIPGQDTALLRVHYVDHPRAYDRDRTYTFGLQAMPARPMPETSRGQRSTRRYQYGYEDADKHPAWLSTVDYWAEGNVDEKRGTAEIWMQPVFDPAAHGDTEIFLDLAHGKGYRLKLEWRPGDAGLTAILLNNWRPEAVLQSGFHPDPGGWTHVAVTWGDRMRLFVQGQPVAESAPRDGLYAVGVMNLYAGGRNVRVDGFRISNIERTRFDLTQPATADTYTLLLDHFERLGWVNGRQATLPERVSRAAEAGYLTPDATMGPGRWGRGVGPLQRPVRSALEGYAHLGIKQVMFHASQYTDEACAGLYIKEEDRFRKATAAIRDLDMDVVVYLNNSLSNWDRMWDAYADEMLIEPRGSPFIQSWIPGEKTYQACPFGEYLEYYLWRLGRLMDEYGIDGYFLDGRMYTTCINTRHGCGIENFDGEFVASRNVWQGWVNQWRMFDLIKSRGGYAEQHKSAQWDAPTCFLWDCVWEGEQFMGRKREEGQRRLDLLPLLAMRAQMNGFPYGMPVRFEVTAFAPFTPIELCTYAFVHGTTPSATYRADELLVAWPYWKAQDAFGANLQNFVGYWADKPPALETPHELIKVSAHVRENRALIMLTNFDEEHPGIAGEVRLNLPALGLRAPRARDAFSGEPVELAGGDRLPVAIRSFRQAWFLLEEEEGSGP